MTFAKLFSADCNELQQIVALDSDFLLHLLSFHVKHNGTGSSIAIIKIQHATRKPKVCMCSGWKRFHRSCLSENYFVPELCITRQCYRDFSMEPKMKYCVCLPFRVMNRTSACENARLRHESEGFCYFKCKFLSAFESHDGWKLSSFSLPSHPPSLLDELFMSSHKEDEEATKKSFRSET